ncbi:hypothetical protein NBRC10512_003164 [Rhodotorula toruloides]|uniref:RHTO0S05e08900g1_1 n=2 Tax=Rhodotorula toruloides TaxID=5286 RepID=A0A061B1N9_RHOTO|nr:regulatory protein Ral2 [Rhodotorula toruloides NP11]EMS23757.1 regulatory protein Ral2 [Rhodotorula toruloides NP11]CDR40921.1 RHTO0S05e08900g1_1 [Rhodotorula toruloides]
MLSSRPVSTSSSSTASASIRAPPVSSSPRPAGQISSAADLTASVRRTTGDRPPPLVGCSVTLVGEDEVYVFGGRLVPTRTMVATLYCLDLRTLEWRKVWPAKAVGEAVPSEDEPSPPGAFGGGSSDETETFAPQARYFHSACAWEDKLVIFGGEGYGPTAPGTTPDTPSPENDPTLALKTLDDVCIWDTKAGKWIDGATTCKEGVEQPAARYAHLGVVTSVKVEEGEGEKSEAREKAVMLVMGGQDIRNTYLHSMNVLDLNSMTWIQASNWDRHIGTYRAVATCPRYTVVPTAVSQPVPASSDEIVDDAQRAVRGERGAEKALGLNEGESLIQLSHSTIPPASDPEPLILFSNFNFTQVRRDLDLLTSPLSPSNPLEATSLSSSFSGTSLPPGLRFPTGAIVGRHFLVFGTFLSSAINNFSIWALDLGPGGAKGVKDRIEKGEKLEWTRVDPGSVLAKGSWNRAVSWRNSVVVLGDRERDIASDYDHRQTNFAHVAFIDLESFGIYQPPPQSLPPIAQSFGLLTLAQPFLSDFEIICSDGKRLACSRKVLTDRWPWFAAKMEEFKSRALAVQAAQQLGKAQPVENGATSETPASTATDDLRLTPRTLDLPEASSVVQAFLQYLYTLTLCTPLQLHPPVLAALAIFSRTYEDDALWALCVHALHGVLEKEVQAAPLVYEAATMSGSTALQIRALRTMLSNPAVRMRQSPRPPSQPQDISAVPQSAGGFARAVGPPAQSTTTGRQRAHPANLHSLSAGPPVSTSRTPRQLPGPLRSPRSPRFPEDPPLSPAPSSPLPRPPSKPSPSSLCSGSETCDTQSLRSKSSKPPSDAVAEPTPDEVAPIPVPQWSPFAPDPTLSPRLASGFFDTSPSTDSVLASSPPSLASHGLANSPTRSTRSGPHAPSTRSRTDSVGQRSVASTSSSCAGGLYGWTNLLEPQIEEDEDGPAVASDFAEVRNTARGSLNLPHPHEARTPSSTLPSQTATTSRLSASSAMPIQRPGATPQSSNTKGETHWAPSFFDTVKSDGSVRNPLSSRKATQISQDLLAQLDLDRLVEQSTTPAVAVSPPIAVTSSLADQYFDNPRPAPAPSPLPRLDADSPAPLATSPATTPGLLPVAFSPPSRRHSLEPTSAVTSSPRSSTPSTPGRGGKSRPSTASTVSGSSVAMSSGPSSSGESVYSTDELLTPPTPSVGLPPLSPKSAHTLSPLHALQQPNATVLDRRPSLPAASSAIRTAVATSTTTGQKRASLSSRLSTKPLSKKEERQALELSVGRKVLEAAGASETEIRLRARSVGHQVLKQREEEAKRGGKGGKNAVALGDYLGGVELSSKFSIG